MKSGKTDIVCILHRLKYKAVPDDCEECKYLMEFPKEDNMGDNLNEFIVFAEKRRHIFLMLADQILMDNLIMPCNVLVGVRSSIGAVGS